MRPDTIYDNRDILTSHGSILQRQHALQIAEAGIKSVIPYESTKKYINLRGRTLTVGTLSFDLDNIEHIYVVGVGKGSYPIALAIDEILGDSITDGFLVVKEGEKRTLPHIKVFESSHPFPDQRSVTGALRIKEILEKAGPNDIVFAAVTGGASALVNIPAGNITIDEMCETNRLLLRCGADIRQMNAVRKHLCNLKGGRIVQYGQPAFVITFTLDTNTPGMPWPDLCLPDPSTFQDAITVLKNHNLWDKVPASVRERLLDGDEHPEKETLKTLDGMKQALFSVGNQRVACAAAAQKAKELGYTPLILSSCIDGEAKDVGMVLAGITNEIISSNNPIPAPCALISGGETTITIVGRPESGGPNQECVFGFVNKLRSKEDVAFISIDTDGTDGPTDIAGGIVDGYTKEEMVRCGISFSDIFSKHGTSFALSKLNDAIYTGNTGTNVMNLRVVVIGKPSSSHANDTIKKIEGREILNAKGMPTVEAKIETTEGNTAIASVPCGTSQGSYEAKALYDGGSRYNGRGTRTAAGHVSNEINSLLVGKPLSDPSYLDKLMIKLDGTTDKSRLGANAILASSVAVAKASAMSKHMPLYKSLYRQDSYKVPDIIATVIAGGAFSVSASALEFEDYLYIFSNFDSFDEELEALVTLRAHLQKKLTSQYGVIPEDGGALAAPLKSTEDAFTWMLQSVKECGYEGKVTLGLDVAASELYDKATSVYRFNKVFNRDELLNYYEVLCQKYPLTYIEDAFHEDDVDGFAALQNRLPNVQNVGDDLFASNIARLREYHTAANGLLLKINQIGTVSEAIAAAEFAQKHDMDVIVSLRSGETTDDFIADLAVAVKARQIKLGSPVRAERNAKYNRLLQIAEELGR